MEGVWNLDSTKLRYLWMDGRMDGCLFPHILNLHMYVYRVSAGVKLFLI